MVYIVGSLSLLKRERDIHTLLFIVFRCWISIICTRVDTTMRNANYGSDQLLPRVLMQLKVHRRGAVASASFSLGCSIHTVNVVCVYERVYDFKHTVNLVGYRLLTVTTIIFLSFKQV